MIANRLKSAKALLFDKDGTLFDFQATWAPWAYQLIDGLAEGDPKRLSQICAALGYDFESRRFLPDSFSVSCTPEEQVAVLRPILSHLTEQEMLRKFEIDEASTEPALIVGLEGALMAFKQRGLKLAVVTNDFEGAARVQLEKVNINAPFDVVIGFDSGFGGKPEPDGCLAAARALGVRPEQAVMIGDSLHDLHAGRAAQMMTIGVLTGTAQHADLAPFADLVLNDVTEIIDYI